METAANIAMLGVLLFMMIYPKYLFCKNYNKGLLSLADQKPNYTVKENALFMLPFYNTRKVAMDLGMTAFPTVYVINAIVLVVAMVLRFIGMLFLANGYVVGVVVTIYYFALLLTVVVDLIFVFVLAGYFDHKMARLWALISPIGYISLSRAVTRYFAASKDELSGAFAATKELYNNGK